MNSGLIEGSFQAADTIGGPGPVYEAAVALRIDEVAIRDLIGMSNGGPGQALALKLRFEPLAGIKV